VVGLASSLGARLGAFAWWVESTIGGAPTWNWLPLEGASPRLDLVPLWVRAWYRLPFIDRYAHAWMWQRGAWEVRPPDVELGHMGGTE
jgi:hypothetical protein